MKTAKKNIIEAVVSGDMTAEAAVAATANHDPRWGQNYPFAPVIHQSGPAVGGPKGAAAEGELNDITHDDSRLINDPLSGALKWPRGSHESLPQTGDAPRYLSATGPQYRQGEESGMLDAMIDQGVSFASIMKDESVSEADKKSDKEDDKECMMDDDEDPDKKDKKETDDKDDKKKDESVRESLRPRSTAMSLIESAAEGTLPRDVFKSYMKEAEEPSKQDKNGWAADLEARAKIADKKAVSTAFKDDKDAIKQMNKYAQDFRAVAIQLKANKDKDTIYKLWTKADTAVTDQWPKSLLNWVTS